MTNKSNRKQTAESPFRVIGRYPMRRGKLSRAVVYLIEDSRDRSEEHGIIVEAGIPVACTCTNATKWRVHAIHVCSTEGESEIVTCSR